MKHKTHHTLAKHIASRETHPSIVVDRILLGVSLVAFAMLLMLLVNAFRPLGTPTVDTSLSTVTIDNCSTDLECELMAEY
jgi:hypothetical protein